MLIMDNTEKTLQLNIGKYLEYWFNVQYEVYDDSKKNRIDIVCTHKTCTEIVLGIEVKKDEDKRGNMMGKWVKQAMRYSNATWNEKQLPIFIYPPISLKYFVLNDVEHVNENVIRFQDRHDYYKTHHSFNGFISQFALGELRKLLHNDWRTKKDFSYLCFVYNNMAIWRYNKSHGSEEVFNNNYDTMIKHIIKNKI